MRGAMPTEESVIVLISKLLWIKRPISEHYLELKGIKCYSLKTQVIFWIYSTIRLIVFIIH